MAERRWLAMSVSLLLIASACSGDEADASEDLLAYFEQVEQITVDAHESNEGLPQTTDIASARIFFAGVNAAGEVALDSLSSLVAPEAARESHDSLVEIRSQYHDLNQRIAERLDNIETPEEFAALASDPELGIPPQNALAAQVEAACRDLQAVADAEAMDVSLDCDLSA